MTSFLPDGEAHGRGGARLAFVYLGASAVVAGSSLTTTYGVASLLRGSVALGALVAIALGVRRNRPDAGHAWLWLWLGFALWFVGDTLWDWFAWRGIDDPSATHWADFFYLSAYPILGVGLLGLVRARSRTRSRDGILDGSILAAATIIVVWVLLVAPQQTTGTATVDSLILAAYPLGDGLLLAGLGWLALSPGRRCASIWLLGSSLLTVFVVDVLWNLAARFGYSWEHWLNPWYPLAYAMVGAAALHPSVRVMTEPIAQEGQRVHPARLVFLGIALFVGPVVAMIDDGAISNGDVMVTACTVLVAAFVVTRFVSLVNDNERASAALARQATHDALTDLPNRRLLFDRLDAAIAASGGRREGMLALLFIDLDRFKLVNDLLGHDAGDALLIEVAARIETVLRPTDLVARLGGDEFVVMLEGVASPDEAEDVGRRIIACIEEPIPIGDGVVDVGASIGIAFAGPDDDPDAVMRDADVAMYRAKDDGRGRYEVFRDDVASDSVLSESRASEVRRPA